MADESYVWKAILTEFLGTFTLVFIGAGTAALTAGQGGSLVASAFAFGLTLAAIIYAWGNYSGAHVNPAVSFGFVVAGRMNILLMLAYWVAQMLGGVVAAALIAYFFGTASGAGATVGSLTNSDAWRAVLFEAFLTFLLVITILLITRNPMLAIVSGLAIGFVLTANTFAGTSLTGASMNPARSFGPAIFANTLGTYWIYICGPLLGSLAAALVYRLFTIDFSVHDKVDENNEVIKDECGHPLQEGSRPMVDNCGNTLKNDKGEAVRETFVKHERMLTHHQESPMFTMGEWMSAHGFDPRYIKQELHSALQRQASAPPMTKVPATVPTTTVPTAASSGRLPPLTSLPKQATTFPTLG